MWSPDISWTDVLTILRDDVLASPFVSGFFLTFFALILAAVILNIVLGLVAE